jgi:hypothetical protein
LATIEDDADVSSFWNAAGQRFTFWGRAMSVGARWAWSVLDKAARIFAVAAILAVSVGGVLLHQPAAVIGGVLGALAVLSFGEGTYRVWRETSRDAADDDADALWLSEQLSAGNEILARWTAKPRYNATEEIQEADRWERETQAGLAARLPTHCGHFGVDVGFGSEWFSSALVGPERGLLGRRIHRLAEISERYGRECSQ